ncbi:MAG: type III pantothenate kinase, partial [Acidobacteriota bacterium]|nr:type III pantothenate kinase [Acidobacteriota bacterium]
MLLAIDIGNTNTSLGVFDGEHLIENWRIATDRERTSDELGVLIRQMLAFSNFDYQKISALIVSSVV